MAVQFDIIAKLRADTKQFIAGMKSSEVASSNLATSVGSAGSMVGVGLAASVAVAGIALFKLGESFHEAYKTIRVGTGQTGEALKGLEESFKNVYAKTPASMKDVSMAISDVSVKLGLTGAPLEAMSLQFIKLSRITGTDLKGNIEAVTMVFKNFNVAADDQSKKMDLLYRTSQTSGVSVDKLAGTMSSSGVVLRQLGFDFDKSAALIGTFAKAGIDAGDVMPALQFSLKTAGKAGVDAAEQFKKTFDAIKEAPGITEATGIALDVFGGRAGAKMAAAIQEGKLSWEDYLKVIQEGSDTISKSASDVSTFGGKLKTTAHQIQIAFEPLATVVFKGLNDAMKIIQPTIGFVVGGLSNIVKAFQDLPTPVQIIIPLIAGLVIGWELLTGAVTLLSTAFTALYTAVLPIIMKGIMTLGFLLGDLFAAMGMNIAMSYNLGAALATGIGGALAIVTVAWMAYNFFAGQGTSTNLAGTNAAKEFKKALEGTPDDIDKNTAAIIANTFANDKNFKALRDGGGDVKTFGAAITGSKDAITAYQDDVGKFGNLNDFIDHVKRSAAAGDTYSQSLLALHDQGGQTWKSVDALAQGMITQTLTYDAAVTSQETEIGMQQGLQTENDKTTQSIKAQTDAMQAKTDKLRAATDPMYAALSAQSNLATAQKNYNDIAKDGSKTEQEKKDAAIALTKAYGDYGFALRDLDKANTAAGGSSQAMQEYLQMAVSLGLDPAAESTKKTLGAMYNLGTELGKIQAPSDELKGAMERLKDPVFAAGEEGKVAAAQLAAMGWVMKDINGTQVWVQANADTEGARANLGRLARQLADLYKIQQADTGLDLSTRVNAGDKMIKYHNIAQAYGYASGGMMRDGMFVVGENGPELGIKQGGAVRILSNPQSTKMLSDNKMPGGNVVNVNVNGSDLSPQDVGREVLWALKVSR
jgi:TP901 family phage tail tape measure protein